MSLLSENVIINQSSWARVVTHTTLYSAAIDMRDAEGIMGIFLGSTGTRGTTGKPLAIKLQGASDTGATFVNIGSSAACQTIAKTKNTITNSILILDVLHPDKNFVRFGVYGSSGLTNRLATMKYGLRKRGSSGLNVDQLKVAAHALVLNSCSTA